VAQRGAKRAARHRACRVAAACASLPSARLGLALPCPPGALLPDQDGFRGDTYHRKTPHSDVLTLNDLVLPLNRLHIRFFWEFLARFVAFFEIWKLAQTVVDL